MKIFVIDYYKKGLFTDKDLDQFVAAGWISEEEKQELIKNK